MKKKLAGLLICILLSGCNNTSKSSNDTIFSERISDTIFAEVPAELNRNKAAAFLAITSNALQVVDASTGSTKELPVGMEMEQLTGILKRILNTELPESQVNSECGAGPMNILALENGLLIMSQNPGKDSGKGKFVGWSLTKSSQSSMKVTTIAGIGIGSTRVELEEVYVTEIKKTTLGNEFSIGGEIFGILNSRDEIEFMWSGLSCNFR